MSEETKAYSPPKPSAGQQQIVDYLKAGKNVKTDAVAGCGKTTATMIVASSLRDLRILNLTYNSRLKFDGRAKAEAMRLTNIDVHSYHSACCEFYRRDCHTDQVIIDIVSGDAETLVQKQYDLVILDEQQDMNGLYYRLACKIMRDYCKPDLQIMTLGDRNQTLYFYNGADPLFMDLSDRIFPSEREWVTVSLNVTYRVPSVICDFVNRRMLHHERLVPARPGGKVHYRLTDSFRVDSAKELVSDIELFLTGGYKPQDIFILANTIRTKRSSHPVAKLVSAIQKSKFNPLVFIPTSDDQTLTDNIMMNKIVFGSFCQTKGLERRVVIVLGFDNSYFKYYNTTGDPKVCPNVLYVAATRAIDHLVLVHDKASTPLPFLDIRGLDLSGVKSEDKDVRNEPIKFGVLDVMRGHGSEFLRDILDSHIKVSDADPELAGTVVGGIAVPASAPTVLKIKSEVKMRHGDLVYFEAVSHLYGTAATIAAEVQVTGRSDTLGYVRDRTSRESKRYARLEKWIAKPGDMATADYLELANMLIAHHTGLKHQLKQIKGYKWVDEARFKLIVDRIVTRTTPAADSKTACKFEEDKSCVYRISAGKHDKAEKVVAIRGLIDILQPGAIWEIKCTSSTQIEHFIQLAIYYALLKPEERKGRKAMLFNAVCGKTYQIEVSEPDRMMERIIRNRLLSHHGMTVDEFWAGISGEDTGTAGTTDAKDRVSEELAAGLDAMAMYGDL